MLGVYALMAQTATGTITDENGEPLFGVSVIEKNTYNGVTTDFDGKFSLTLSTQNPVIVIKFVGYRDFEVAYTGAPITHKMEVDDIGLDAVVISASKRKERVMDAPASVSIISAEKIQGTAAVVATDNLKNIPGVDVMPTGLVSSNVTVRGFNGIFSGSMLTVIDGRFAGVPSLKVNAFQLMPGGNDDIEKIELVRGPGSALYGPNASEGVMQIITKSPLNMSSDHNAETTISFTGGSRSVWSPNIRHAQKINNKLGFKISAGYMQGHDFEYYDPREPAIGSQFVFGTVLDGTRFVVDEEQGLQSFDRNFFIQKYNADARIDYVLNKDIDFTASVGYANSSNLELTGLGAAQSDGWGYTYGQFKARWKNLFFNYFLNASNSGDTYLISQVDASDAQPYSFQTLLDKSKFHGIQIQHNSKWKGLMDFTYGFDVFLTRPLSDGTIYGRYEEDDNINQYGLYGQAEWHVNPKVDILAALRGDYQDRIKEFMISPRAALVYKPTPRHTARFTYNRAFSSPSALTTALDLPQLFVPNGITARGLGNPSGFNYNYGVDGNAQFRSPDSYGLTNQWYDVNDLSNNNVHFDGFLNSLTGLIASNLYGDNPNASQLAFIKNELVNLTGDLSTSNSSLNNNVGRRVIDFITNEEFDYTKITDLESVKSTVTQTLELGYKGIIKDKLFLSTDLYYTIISDFISPLSPASYRVLYDQDELAQELIPVVQSNLASTNSLIGSVNTNGEEVGALASLARASGVSISQWLVGAMNGFSLGTIAPDNDLVNSDLILTYLNLGKVNVMGADFGATYVEKIKETDFTVSGMFSFVNKDRIALEGASGGYIALNAPKYKTAVSVEAGNIAKTGLGGGINWRWQDAFPANSAIYVGDVSAANLIDVSLTYRPNFSKNTIVSGTLYNVTNNKFQRFPGTPYIGFYAMFKVAHTFNYNIGKNKKTAE
jgi:outer membrane receptor for ferrienterochelin and colicins